MSSIVARREYVDAVREYDAHLFLLSGGGNDLLGEGRFVDMLLPYSDGAVPQALIDRNALESLLAAVSKNYRQILDDVFAVNPAVIAFGHAYDEALPREDGNWLGKPLETRGIPLDVGRDIVSLILGEFSEFLKALADEYENFHVVDLLGAVGSSANSWADELHPRNPGFERIADRFRAAILAQTTDQSHRATADAGTLAAASNLADEYHDDDAPDSIATQPVDAPTYSVIDTEIERALPAHADDVPIASSFAQRTLMAQKIVDFEARRDRQGRLAIYRLPPGDGGGRYEVAGINERYHKEEADHLVALIRAGRHDEAEQYAVEFIATYTDPADRWCRTAAIEFYLRDCMFNRGPGGAAWITQHAVGAVTDRVVGPITRRAIAQAENNPRQLLERLRASRETYERRRRDESSRFWRGLVNRWNNAKAFALTFLQDESGEEHRRSAEPQHVAATEIDHTRWILNCVKSQDTNDDWRIESARDADVLHTAYFPDEFDLREDWWAIASQGDTGSCVGWATADSVLRWHFVKSGRLAKDDLLSIRFIWVAAKETDIFNNRPTTFIEGSGTSLKAALDVARKLGNVKADILPFDRSKVFAGREASFYARAAQLKINSYINMSLDLSHDLSVWRQWLYQNGPILMRLDVDNSFFRASATNGRLERYDRRSRQGGHAVALVGYTQEGFIVRNSWSTRWGNQGFALATDAYAEEAFTEAYGVTV